MNAKFRLGAALLALVMCLTVLVGCNSGITVKSVEKDPYAAVMTGSEKYTDALSAKYGDVFAVFDKLSEGPGTYTVDYSAPAAEESAEDAASSVMADIGLNIVADPATGAYSGKLEAGSMGITTEISLWGDKNNIALSAPILLGEGNYGVKLDTLETDLETSELITYLTGMTFEELKASMETEGGVKWDDLKGMFSVDSWKAAYDKYLADVEAVYDGLTAVVAEENLKIGETEVPAISVQYTVDVAASEKVTAAATEFYNSLFGSLLSFVQGDVDLDALIAESGIDTSVEGTEKYYLNKTTGALMGADVSMDGIEGSIIFGEDASKTLDMLVDFDFTVDGETVTVVADVNEITEEGKGGFDIDMSIKTAEGEETAKMSFVRTDADGKYEVKITAGELEYSIAGVLTYSDTELTLTVDSVTVTAAGENKTIEVGLTISAKAEGTVEAVPEYTNIITMPAEELESLISMIGLLGGSSEGYPEEYPDEYPEEYPEETIDMEQFYEDLYEGMTDEEIAAFESEMAELGVSIEDLL